MVVLKLSVLLQGLLLVARCEVRARDPDVEDEDELKDMSDGGRWDHRVPLIGFGAARQGEVINRKRPDVYGDLHHPVGHHDNGHQDVPEETVDPSSATETTGSFQRTG